MVIIFTAIMKNITVSLYYCKNIETHFFSFKLAWIKVVIIITVIPTNVTVSLYCSKNTESVFLNMHKLKWLSLL